MNYIRAFLIVMSVYSVSYVLSRAIGWDDGQATRGAFIGLFMVVFYEILELKPQYSSKKEEKMIDGEQ